MKYVVKLLVVVAGVLGAWHALGEQRLSLLGHRDQEQASNQPKPRWTPGRRPGGAKVDAEPLSARPSAATTPSSSARSGPAKSRCGRRRWCECPGPAATPGEAAGRPQRDRELRRRGAGAAAPTIRPWRCLATWSVQCSRNCSVSAALHRLRRVRPIAISINTAFDFSAEQRFRLAYSVGPQFLTGSSLSRVTTSGLASPRQSRAEAPRRVRRTRFAQRLSKPIALRLGVDQCHPRPSRAAHKYGCPVRCGVRPELPSAPNSAHPWHTCLATVYLADEPRARPRSTTTPTALSHHPRQCSDHWIDSWSVTVTSTSP